MKAQGEARDLVFRMSGLEGIPEWLVDAIELWIDLYMPSRLNVRLYPFDELPEFQLIGNLKRDSFVNDDLDTLRLAYGSYPDQKLTIFGLVTSLPPAGDEYFEPLPEFAATADASGNITAEETTEANADLRIDHAEDLAAAVDQVATEIDDAAARKTFEHAFRGVFKGVEGLEQFVRFARYPAVVVQPLAIYRTIRLSPVQLAAAPESAWRAVKRFLGFRI